MTCSFKRLSLAILVVWVGFVPSLSSDELPDATPEEVGVSSERLQTMHRFVEDSVKSYPLTGAITLIARHGKVVDFQTYGYQDKLAGIPMEKDAIFALASMTKTIVSAGTMILVEQGHVRLSDPISRYLPELAKRQVYLGSSGNGIQTRPAKSPILIRHLLTHTAGWAGNRGQSSLDRIYTQSAYRQASSLNEFVENLATLPLQDDPGTAYTYGPSIDVLGALIERVSGTDLQSFLEHHLFTALGMKDTFFEIPAKKRHRAVQMFTHRNGELAYAEGLVEQGDMRRGYPSGGGGLYSTAPDYYRFAQMLLDQGTFEGRSILGKKTVQSMMRNQTGFLGDKMKSNNRSEAYGFGGSVKTDTFYEKDISSVGSYGWGGAYSTWYRIDPEEEFIALIFAQHTPMAASLMPYFANTAWQAIVD